MSSRALFFFVAGALGVFLLLAPQFAEAAPAKCVPVYRTEYTCQSEGVCGAGTLQRSCNSCGGCGGWRQHQAGQVSRICPTGRGIQRDPIGLVCTGRCYIPPNLKPFNDPSLSPQNVFGEDGAAKLPVNIGWDESAEQQIVSKDACSIGSYRYRITGRTGGVVFDKAVINPRLSCEMNTADSGKTCGAVFTQAYKNEDGAMMNKAHALADKYRGYVSNPDGTETVKQGVVSPTYNYMSRQYDYALGPASDNLQALVRNPERSCILTPGQSYELNIKSCIDQAGNDCGKDDSSQRDKWSTLLPFSTYQAPELISPFDKDFQGSGNSNPKIPVALEWCKDPLAESYALNFTRKTTPEEFKETGLAEIRIPLDNISKDKTSYIDDPSLREIKNRVLYYWRVVSCMATRGEGCTQSSQKWSLFVQDVLDVPEQLTSDPIVNTKSILEWYQSIYIPLYFVHIQGGGQDLYETTKTRSFELGPIWSSLQPNTQYSWRVVACPLEATKPSECNKDKEGQTGWSASASFKTTGNPPAVQLNPSRDGSATLPLQITWNPVPGALSYRYEIKEQPSSVGFTPNAFLKAVPTSSNDTGVFQLETNKAYTLKVSSCASADGTYCGSPTAQRFTVVLPQKPEFISPAPSSIVSLPDVDIRWKPTLSGEIYQYSTTYLRNAPDEKNSSCLGKVGAQISSKILTTSQINDRFSCAGEYEARVAACMDSTCAQKGEEAVWTFSATVGAQRSAFAGLIPCGKSKRGIPAPPWNELEPCEFRHVFLLGKIFLDFLLYSATPTLVVLFALYTGVIAYFSFGTSDMLSKIKSIWRAVGIGILIMFFSWMFMNLLLSILGFNVNIFGRWYDIRLK